MCDLGVGINFPQTLRSLYVHHNTTWVFPFYCELLASVKVETLFFVGDRFPSFYLPAYAKEEEKTQGSLEKPLGHSGYQPVRLA